MKELIDLQDPDIIYLTRSLYMQNRHCKKLKECIHRLHQIYSPRELSSNFRVLWMYWGVTEKPDLSCSSANSSRRRILALISVSLFLISFWSSLEEWLVLLAISKIHFRIWRSSKLRALSVSVSVASAIMLTAVPERPILPVYSSKRNRSHIIAIFSLTVFKRTQA